MCLAPRLEHTSLSDLSVSESYSKDDEPKKPSEPLSYNLAEKFAIVGVLETLTIGTLLAVVRAFESKDMQRLFMKAFKPRTKQVSPPHGSHTKTSECSGAGGLHVTWQHTETGVRRDACATG